MTERSYGALSRSLRLPFSVDPDKVEARWICHAQRIEAGDNRRYPRRRSGSGCCRN
jgi:hypothetical protein